jgi:hypothetical protein
MISDIRFSVSAFKQFLDQVQGIRRGIELGYVRCK